MLYLIPGNHTSQNVVAKVIENYVSFLLAVFCYNYLSVNSGTCLQTDPVIIAKSIKKTSNLYTHEKYSIFMHYLTQ